MKCTATREQLIEPVSRTERMTGKNHTLPILSCVHLEVKGNKLSITATNLEVGITHTVDISNTKEGSVAVSGSTFSHVVSALQSGSTVTLESQEGYLLVTSSEGQAKISLQEVEEFPALPTVEGGVEVTMPAKALVTAITSVSYCASGSTIKPELSSVYLHPDGGTLIAASTDSFRLAEKRVPLKNAVTTDPFLVPAKSAGDLVKALEVAEDTVTISMNEHQLSLSLPNIYMTLRLVNGSFPDYSQIIPKDFMAEATMLRYDFERVLKKAAIFSDQFNQTTITIKPKKKELTVHTEHSNVGETTDTISAALEGSALTISFNHHYLIDALHSIQGDSITLQFAGQSQPAIVRPVGDASFFYLVMPMNR